MWLEPLPCGPALSGAHAGVGVVDPGLLSSGGFMATQRAASFTVML